MSGVWKRSHGRTSEAPPDERGGNSYARPTATAPHSDSTITREKAYLEQEFGDDCRHFRAAVRRWLQRQSSHRLTETQCQRRCPRRSGPHRQSPRRRTDAPVRVSRRVRVPEHDLVEIDRLGLRAPVAVDAEARLCVDEGRAVAAGAIVAIGHGSLVVAAKCAVEPDVDAAAGVMGGIEAHLDRGPALPRQVTPADLCAHHHRRLGAGAPAATCAKKRTRSPSGRASILKKGLALHDFPPLKESCLIWWMTVRQGWRPAAGTSCGQSPAILNEKRYHTGWPNFTSSPAPVARSDLT